jgi:murein DD-endopeptidase MepM/ murein hydrolase activator NlpD
MALPILAKGITSALVKKGKSAKKDDKVSAQKLLPNSTTSPAKSRAQFSKVEPRKLAPYRKKVETTKFLPPSKVDEKFSINKLDALLTSLVGSTANLQRITKKDLSDERKNNRTKENIKQKSKRQRNEEKTESKKTVAKVSKPMKLTMPSLFMDIFKIGGRLILSLGIMELLKFLDPEKKESIFGFLTEHLDKIILGTLGILGITFVASFLPVISMVGTILSIVSPIIMAMAGLLLNPMIWALLGVGYAATKQKLGDGEKEMVRQLENQLPNKKDRDNPLKVFAKSNRNKLIEKLKKQKENLNPLEIVQGVGLEIDENIGFLETGKFRHGIEIEGLKVPGLPFNYEMGGELDFETGEATGGFSFKKSPEVQTQPQSPMMGDTKLGGVSGDSGSAMYKGRGKKAALSTGITPFLQSDIDKQGISIISGFGKRFGRDHKGYDLPAAEGTPLHAYLPGVVVRNMPNVSGYGNLVEWKDDVYGQTHMFAHMMEPSELRSGTKFKAGTVLGKVGTTDGGTGISEGPHLHWEIGPQGSEVDPGEWLKSHPINMAPKKPPNKAQEVSSTTSYEETGTQVAMIQVPLPVPMPLPGGGGGASSGGSRSSGGIDDIDSIILGRSFSNA